MDYDMPIMNGVQAARAIKNLVAEGKVKDIPIVAASSYVATTEKQKCIDAGMLEYINKPYSFDTLVQLLLKYMPQKMSNLSKQFQSRD